MVRLVSRCLHQSYEASWDHQDGGGGKAERNVPTENVYGLGVGGTHPARSSIVNGRPVITRCRIPELQNLRCVCGLWGLTEVQAVLGMTLNAGKAGILASPTFILVLVPREH